MTYKPMLSVERKVIEDILEDAREPATDYMAARKVLRALIDNPSHRRQEGYDEAMGKVVAVLEDQSCGACDGCANGCKLDRESPQVEPATPHQGEPVTKAKPVAKLHAERMTGRDGEYGITAENSKWFNTCRLTGGIFNLYAEQPAPVAEVMPFVEKVIAMLQRFEACVSDGQDVDIDRHWFDVLTHLGLLRRVQRSPAYWEITQLGEDALKTTRFNSPQ